MPLDNDEITCAFSGLTPADEAYTDDDDGSDGVPVGWTRVTIARCIPNPEYAILQGLKAGTLQQLLQQVPEAQRAEAEPLLEMQVRVQYHAYESTLEPFLLEEDEVFLAPGALDKDIAEAHKSFRETLGLVADEAEAPEPAKIARKKKKEGSK